VKAEQAKEEQSELETAQQEIKKLQQELAKAQEKIKDLTEELNEEKTQTEKPKITHRKGTKLDKLKAFVLEGLYTKEQLMQKLSVSAGTLAVYLTKLRNELGLRIMKNTKIIQCA
jgi:hypothetical protein